MDDQLLPFPEGNEIRFDGGRLSVGGVELEPGRYQVGDTGSVLEVYEGVAVLTATALSGAAIETPPAAHTMMVRR